MVTTKSGDFIEIDYVGRTKSQNKVFDLTSAEVAKKEGIFDEKQKYGPMVICLGQNHLLAGLDKFLIGKETNKEYVIELKPEEAFGKRNPKLIKITNTANFKNQKVPPMPGMQFSVDGAVATIRSVTGGRVILDFNHTLSGKELSYTIKILRVLEQPEEKLNSLFKLLFKVDDAKVTLNDKEVLVDFKSAEKFPPTLADAFKTEIDKLIPELTGKKLVIGAKQDQKEIKPKTAQTEAKVSPAPVKKQKAEVKQK